MSVNLTASKINHILLERIHEPSVKQHSCQSSQNDSVYIWYLYLNRLILKLIQDQIRLKSHLIFKSSNKIVFQILHSIAPALPLLHSELLDCWTAGLLVVVHQLYQHANDSFEALHNGLKRAIASAATSLSFELSKTPWSTISLPMWREYSESHKRSTVTCFRLRPSSDTAHISR